jgi:hypothetical protein
MPLNPELKSLRDSWYLEAKKQTIETLPYFLNKLSTYPHDYNTICYACGAASVAAAWAIDKSPHGGITGFQAGAIMWEFITEWMNEQDKPLQLVHFENMLYPQYEYRFQKQITQETWTWLQEQAKLNLEKNQEGTHIEVIEHWKSIINGQIPFGYIVKE